MYPIITDDNFHEFLSHILSEDDTLKKWLFEIGPRHGNYGLYFGNLSLANAQQLVTHLEKFTSAIKCIEGYVGYAHGMKVEVAECLLPILRAMGNSGWCNGFGLIEAPADVVRIMASQTREDMNATPCRDGFLRSVNLSALAMHEMMACAREKLLIGKRMCLIDFTEEAFIVFVNALAELPKNAFYLEYISNCKFHLTNYTQFKNLFLRLLTADDYGEESSHSILTTYLPYAVQLADELSAMSANEYSKFEYSLDYTTDFYQDVSISAAQSITSNESANIAEQLAECANKLLKKLASKPFSTPSNKEERGLSQKGYQDRQSAVYSYLHGHYRNRNPEKAYKYLMLSTNHYKKAEVLAWASQYQAQMGNSLSAKQYACMALDEILKSTEFGPTLVTFIFEQLLSCYRGGFEMAFITFAKDVFSPPGNAAPAAEVAFKRLYNSILYLSLPNPVLEELVLQFMRLALHLSNALPNSPFKVALSDPGFLSIFKKQMTELEERIAVRNMLSSKIEGSQSFSLAVANKIMSLESELAKLKNEVEPLALGSSTKRYRSATLFNYFQPKVAKSSTAVTEPSSTTPAPS